MSRRGTLLALLVGLPVLVDLCLHLAGAEVGLGGVLLRAYSLTAIALLLLWGLLHLLRAFLWRVSRRLAFSYFLIGIVPIPLVALLALAGGYLVTGFLLGHLYRDAVNAVAGELRQATRDQADQLAAGQVPRSTSGSLVAFAYYRDGVKFAGATDAPAEWRSWWVAETSATSAPSPETPAMVTLGGRPTLMAAAEEAEYGILALFVGDLELELSERSGVWIELVRSDENRVPAGTADERVLEITFRNRDYPLKLPDLSGRPELRDFFHPGVEQPGWVDRPSFLWVETTRPFFDLESGAFAADHVAAYLTGSPRTVTFHLFSRSAEVDVFVYVVFVTLVFLLFDLYLLAALMALWMSFGLSRAVNQLTRATERVQRGDFAARIEVRRGDQVGALQTSFNRMAANLEELIATATQKEALEAELRIARELQRSLIPDGDSVDPRLAFATYFQPSAAIGGDYYDFLPVRGGRLAVFVGDVSGHGLSAGLRMAMLKSALGLLCETEDRPQEILSRLHRLVRGHTSDGQRGFVTAVLALVDPASGDLTLTNAGHPPTYVLRAAGDATATVEEILLPGSPLGAFRGDFGERTLRLAPGDLVAWLSDGLIEAADADDEPFGYERVVATLGAGPRQPAALRDHLLAAVATHTGGSAVTDDLTVVVMGYRGAVPTAGAALDAAAPDATAPSG